MNKTQRFRQAHPNYSTEYYKKNREKILQYLKSRYVSKKKIKKVRGHYNKTNFIKKYSKEYYEKIYWVEHAEEIKRSPLLITDEWGNIIGYTLNRFYY